LRFWKLKNRTEKRVHFARIRKKRTFITSSGANDNHIAQHEESHFQVG